jgi:uncharacterized membrane protein
MSEPSSPNRPRWAMTPARWLLVAVVVYFAVAFALSWLRALELQTTTWDQGLYQQALWTTAHGRAFYETADVETGGYGSLLEVHSVFLLYLLVPLYAALPTEATMLGVQAAAVALAAIPLYYLARDITSSPRLAFLTGVAYLCWTPTLSSNLYDFHAEAFLPLEIFALALLWHRERYGAAFAVAGIAFLTFEFTPLIAFALGIFALLPPSGTPIGVRRRLSNVVSAPARTLRSALGSRRVRASLALMVVSLAAYLALYEFRVALLPPLVGSYPLPSAASGYIIGTTPGALGLTPGNLAVAFGAKATYWLLVLALLAFVPLLAPRALVLTLPWFAFTMFSSNANYVTLGFQYGLIAGSTLLVAFAYGLPTARRAVDGWYARHAGIGAPLPTSTGAARPSRRTRGAVVAAIGLLIAVNLALTPINPAVQNNGWGSAYRISYDPTPGADNVRALAGLIPAGATVLASDNLFPLVANDPNAYSFLWEADTALYLPFTLANSPTYVLLSEDRTGAVLAWISAALYDPAVYGVRGVAWESPVGTVLLFEHGYVGTTLQMGSAPPASSSYYGARIAAGPIGYAVGDPGSTYPTVVQSVPGAIGTVWDGPNAALEAGNYTVTVSVRVTPLAGFPIPNASTEVLWIGALAFAQSEYDGWSYSYSALNSSSFRTVSFPVTVPGPTIEFELQGELLESWVQVTLNYFSITPG